MLTRFFQERRDQLIGPLHPRDPALAELFGVRPAAAGVDVSERTAISWPALSCGIRLIAETIGMLPVDVCRRRDRGRDILDNHPAARVLDDPNPEQTAFEFKEMLQSHALWWGNGYAQIIRNKGGIPIELWPLSPDRVTVFRDGAMNLIYRIGLPREPYGMAATSVLLPADEVLHIRGFTRYGLMGDRMTQTFRETIGLGLATELFGALFFGQGANAGGVITHPAQLTEEAQERLRKQKENQVAGISRAHRVMILEEGMTWHQTSVDPEKAQFLGTRQFQVVEASRILRIPPHLLYDLTRGTFSNIEQQGIEFVTYTMMPWAVRWEQRLRKMLLGFKDASSTYFKFRMNSLLRGDSAARLAFYQGMIQNGVFSQNDVLELEDLNPIEGGDVHRILSTLVPITGPDVPKPEGAPQSGQE